MSDRLGSGYGGKPGLECCRDVVKRLGFKTLLGLRVAFNRDQLPDSPHSGVIALAVQNEVDSGGCFGRIKAWFRLGRALRAKVCQPVQRIQRGFRVDG